MSELIEQNDIIQDSMNSEFCMIKVIEECAELTEVLSKSITKTDNKPSVEKIIEETGDVICRIMILSEKLGISDKVDKRVIEKLQILTNHLKDKKIELVVNRS